MTIEECACGNGVYDDEQYNSCYSCYLDRRAQFVSCIWCGRWHSPRYDACFQCRSHHPDRIEAGKNLRIEIQLRDHFSCNYCHATEGSMQVDHIKPCAAGGTADPWNLQLLCADCNRWKAASWSEHSRHWNKRVDLMRYYLVFLWPYLDAAQRRKLADEAAQLEQHGADLVRSIRAPFEPEVCADCDVDTTSTTGTCIVCRREVGTGPDTATAA